MKKSAGKNSAKGERNNIQVLIAAMNQTDYSLLEGMNIQTDAIIGNQCDRNEIEHFEWRGHRISCYSFAERGVGLNRATILNRADADIVLFADEDVVYCDDYPEKLKRVYREHPDADVIIFNMLESRDGEPKHNTVLKNRYAGRMGVSSFGMFCVSARLEPLRYSGISFNLMFGGGAKHSCGEDTIFLQDCKKKGLRIFTSTETIGTVIHSDSTWFNGYNDKYFYDKGVVYATIYPRLARVLSVYNAVKHRRLYKEYGLYKAIKQMWCGVKSILKK